MKASTISGPFSVYITVHYREQIFAEYQIKLVDLDINYEKDSLRDKFFYMLQDVNSAKSLEEVIIALNY